MSSLQRWKYIKLSLQSCLFLVEFREHATSRGAEPTGETAGRGREERRRDRTEVGGRTLQRQEQARCQRGGCGSFPKNGLIYTCSPSSQELAEAREQLEEGESRRLKQSPDTSSSFDFLPLSSSLQSTADSHFVRPRAFSACHQVFRQMKIFHQINYYQGWRERGGGRLAPSLGEVSSPDLGVELGEAESDPFSRCLTLLDIFLLNLTSSALREEGREVSWTEWWWKTGTSEGTRRCWNRQWDFYPRMKLIASSPISEGADSEAWQEQGSSAGDSAKVEQEQSTEGRPGWLHLRLHPRLCLWLCLHPILLHWLQIADHFSRPNVLGMKQSQSSAQCIVRCFCAGEPCSSSKASEQFGWRWRWRAAPAWGERRWWGGRRRQEERWTATLAQYGRWGCSGREGNLTSNKRLSSNTQI